MGKAAVLPGDIRYRGWLTYRGIRLIALIAMTLSIIARVLLVTNLVTTYFSVSLFEDAL